MLNVSIKELAGAFAENKDVAKDIRIKTIIPELDNSEGLIILDFDGVTGATQSFIHALISDLIRKYGSVVFDRVIFRNCNPVVEQVVNIVADYMEASYN